MWKIFTISGKERILFFEAVWSIILARLDFIFHSFATLVEKYRVSDKVRSDDIDPNTIPMIRAAIRRAGKISLFKNKCLVHSLAARRMLNKRGISSELYIGIKTSDHAPDFAHAWVVSHDIEVIPSTEWHEKVAEY